MCEGEGVGVFSFICFRMRLHHFIIDSGYKENSNNLTRPPNAVKLENPIYYCIYDRLQKFFEIHKTSTLSKATIGSSRSCISG